MGVEFDGLGCGARLVRQKIVARALKIRPASQSREFTVRRLWSSACGQRQMQGRCGVFHVLDQPVVHSDHAEDDDGSRDPSPDVLRLAKHFGRLGQRPVSSMLALQGTIARSARSNSARLVSVWLPGPSATT